MATEPRFRKLSPEEKRDEIMSKGKQVVLFVCPLCAKASALKVFERDFDIATLELLDVRRTGGKGSGFYREYTQGTLQELRDDPEYKQVIQLIRDRCNEILQELE